MKLALMLMARDNALCESKMEDTDMWEIAVAVGI
jgi:hypothetical protein